MWYVMDRVFNWIGIIEFQKVEIDHRFFEYDRMTFEIPYTKENVNLLLYKNLLYRPNTNKAYIVQTLEYRTDTKQIWGVAIGLESLLQRRVVDHYYELSGDVINAMSYLFNQLFTNNDGWNGGIDRSIPFLINTNNHPVGVITKQIDEAFEGDNFYELMNRLSEEYGFGYDIHYNYEDKKYEFQMRVGYGWYGGQVPKVQWTEKWNSIQKPLYLQSDKYEKNVIFVASGDETPVIEMVGTKTGWDRKEMFSKGEAKYEGRNLSQLKKLLIGKGKTDLMKQKKIRELQYTLNNEMIQGYGTDFLVGDKVNIHSDEFNLTEIKTISVVKETIINDHSTYEITFMEEEFYDSE